MIRQTVNLRHQIPGFNYENEGTQQELEAEYANARRAQTVPFAVAPKQTFRAADGRILTAGMPVVLADFESTPDDPAWRRRERAVWRGIVLEKY